MDQNCTCTKTLCVNKPMADLSRYNKKYKPLARALRKESTPGEIRLWTEVLRAGKFYGYQFNRQYALEGFIVDFICRKLKLIIELDGRSHQFKTEEDQERDKRLLEMGYVVLRFPEVEVMKDLANVIRTLERHLPER
jgi:very-short-patch-repair endonuclease